MSEVKNFYRMCTGNASDLICYASSFITDAFGTGELVYASVIVPSNKVKKLQKELNKSCNIYFSGAIRGYADTNKNKYSIISKKAPKSDYSHCVIMIKDKPAENKIIKTYIYYDDKINREDAVYDCLYKHVSIPIKKEWVPTIINELTRTKCLNAVNSESANDNTRLNCLKLIINEDTFSRMISNLVSNGTLSIDENNKLVNPAMQFVEGLDSYLNIYGDILAEKIQNSFTPKFIPGETEYDQYVNNYDDSCFHKNINMYDAQKNVIQASVNNFKKSNLTMVVGEMGVGSLLCV